MASTIKYGDRTFDVGDDATLDGYMAIIKRVLTAGRAEWIAFNLTEDGRKYSESILISPGVPVIVTKNDPAQLTVQLQNLMAEYLS